VGAALAERTAQALADLRATPEAQEGLSAFLEKRKAKWVEPPAPEKKKHAGKRSR
jgi:1,4-dihydroxy-2-naphthoyl-CoA synthase